MCLHNCKLICIKRADKKSEWWRCIFIELYSAKILCFSVQYSSFESHLFCLFYLPRMTRYVLYMQLSSSQIHSPLLEDIVDSGIGLWYLAGWYDNLMPELIFCPQSGSMNWASAYLAYIKVTQNSGSKSTFRGCVWTVSVWTTSVFFWPSFRFSFWALPPPPGPRQGSWSVSEQVGKRIYRKRTTLFCWRLNAAIF